VQVSHDGIIRDCRRDTGCTRTYFSVVLGRV
jgi:hypothetical protein